MMIIKNCLKQSGFKRKNEAAKTDFYYPDFILQLRHIEIDLRSYIDLGSTAIQSMDSQAIKSDGLVFPLRKAICKCKFLT